MKLAVKYNLLINMILIGIVCGISFYILMVPFDMKSLLHCILMGIIFGFINYQVSYRIFKKYNLLKESNELLKQDLKIDNLTGLFNRRAFDNDILEVPNSSVYSMIFIDIDNFRKFNNEFGHQAGDLVLKKVCYAIKASIRSQDKVYRYGGEEIVVLLKDCEKKNTLEIAEKIRININHLDNSPYPGITVSLGISSCPEDGNEIAKIIEACDNALLTAKNLGKNRTFVCTK